MWPLQGKNNALLMNWCFWIVVLEKTLESPLDCKEIQPVYPKGNQSWVFIGRTDAEAETPILWAPDAKNWCFWTLVLEKNLESPLDCKEIQPVNPKGNQPCIHWKDWCWSWSFNTLVTWNEELTHWERPWCWERLKVGEKGMTEDEMAGWHHQLDGHEFE